MDNQEKVPEQMIQDQLNELNELGVSINIPLTDLQIKLQTLIDTLVEQAVTTNDHLDLRVKQAWVKALNEIKTEVSHNMEQQFGKDWESTVKAKVKEMKSQQAKSGIPRLWTPEAEMRKKHTL